MRIVFSCKWLSTFEHITKFCRPKKAIVAVWILLLSTLKISPIIASISLKLTSSYFSGPMLVIIMENKNLKQKKFQKIDKICRISVATFCVFGNFAATFWHSSKQVSSILRAPSGQACVVESGCHQIFAVQSGILAIGIRNTAQGIRNQTNECNPEYKFQWLKIRNPVPRNRNPHRIQNPRLSWIPLNGATSH